MLRPPPRLRSAPSFALCEAGCRALGVDLEDVLDGTAEPEAPDLDAVAALLDKPSQGRLARYSPAVREAVLTRAIDHVLACVREACAEAAAHRAELVARLSAVEQRMFARWKPEDSGAPLRARLAALGSTEAESLLDRWPLSRLLVHMADCELASFTDQREEATRDLFRGLTPGIA